MVLTLSVVLVVVAFIALYGSRVIFAPVGSPATGEVPTADVVGGFRHAQRSLDFPVTVPAEVPAGWHPNSFSVSDPERNGPGTVASVRGGWVTPAGAFIMLVESAGDPNQVLQSEIGSVGTSRGTSHAGGATWTVTTGVRSEAAWIRSSGRTTFLITGSASEADFVALAESITGA